MRKFELSGAKFVLFFSIFILCVNFVYFTKAFEVLEFPKEAVFAASMPVLFLAALLLIFSLLLIPYLAKPVAILTVLVSASASYFMYNYGTIIDSEMLRNVVYTDKFEAGNLITSKLILWNLILGVIPAIFIIMVKINYANFGSEFIKRAGFVAGSLIVIGLVYIGFGKTYIPYFRQNKELRFYTVPFYPLYSAGKLYKKLSSKPLVFTQIGQDATRVDDGEKKIMVFIVGETERGANYSLNGYTVNDTNAYLKTQTNLVSLTNFRSCGTATAISLPCMFSNLDRENFSVEKADNMSNLLDVLEKAGVNVYWLGNNSGGCKKVCDRLPKENVKQYNASGFDNVIYDDAKEIIKNATEDTLIVLHLQGSHGPVYFEDYPDKFKKFTPTCDTAKLETCTSKEIVNTYDNTILYQDYLQNDLIENMKTKSDKFEKFLVYISDHGESLGEGGLYLHGMPYGLSPDFQRIIPAIFWFDDSEGGLVERLNGMRDKEFSHDYILSTMLGYFKVNSKIYRSNYDIFNIAGWEDKH